MKLIMKTLSKKIIKVILLFLSLSLINCQNEDDLQNKEVLTETNKLITQTLSGNDIPHIIRFIESKSNSKLEFNFGGQENYAASSVVAKQHDTNLRLTKVMTNAIIASTLNNITNYAFDMEVKSSDYFLNLIVKEYNGTPFIYFIKYVKASTWRGKDLTSFTGKIYYYSETGDYKMTQNSINGTIEDNCPYGECGDDDGAGGGGDDDCNDVIKWKCDWRGSLHSSPADCTCPFGECGGQYVYVQPDGCVGNTGINPDINTTNNCPCSWEDNSDDSDNIGSGGGSYTNNCPGVTPCRNELQSFDENCECAYISNPITPVNSPSVVASMKNINACLGMSLTQDQKNWLLDLNNDTSTFALDSYLSTNNCSAEAMEEVRDFLEITSELPNAKYIRYIELTDLLEDNPWALIQDCAEQNGLNTSNYIDLYNHTIPQECSDRLNALGEEYVNQPITDGNVPLANIDYYGVEITIYPDFDNNGYPDSEAEIYDTFRNKFIDLASGEKENFQFSCNIPFNLSNTTDIHWEFEPLTINDGNLFVSDNPLTAIFLIEAGTSGFLTLTADEGTIIVSDFTNNNWTISTITSDENSTQPFSGNRQWGWHINQNNNLELFTRAVDVARVSDIIKKDPRGSEECQQNDYYNIAEATWDNMQQEIAQWVNEYGGQATVVPKTAVRVDKEKLKELLKSNETINQIPCN